ncbi:stimulator of interferon genes protein isoform X2 [Agrilus planipennis]|nr:stimulator of interferon genes protein isoform X2 [Agrilus planipennis]
MTFILSNLSFHSPMNLCWLCLLEFLKLDECPISTSIKLSDFHGLDYGSGMATSFFHGYLKIMLPNTGGSSRSFLEFIELYQAQHKVTFDVRKLFILLPMSCECFPSLQCPSFPNIEESKPLDELERDVAGVKKRIYKNSVYKIKKPNRERVYVSVEYATPLRTFKEVISHNSKYSKIYEKYKNDIVLNFYLTLKAILKENPQCDGLCEVIYYNDKNPDGSYKNVGNLILKRIKEIRGTLKKKKD